MLPSQRLLYDLSKLHVEQKQKLEKMFQTQKQLMNSPQLEAYNQLLLEQRQFKEQIDSILNSLTQLYRTVILEPPELQKVYTLRHEINIQLKQLELLTAELQQLVQPNNTSQWSLFVFPVTCLT
jgi:Sec7-like guanine-nucleotide exchange factor